MPNINNGFQLAAPAPGSGGRIPETVERALAAGYAAAQGALLLVDADGKYAECGVDPAAINAVALTPGGTDTSGFNILGTKEFPSGYMQGILIRNGVRFISAFVGAIPAAPGGQYGVIRDADGEWKVDFNDIVNVKVVYTGVVDFRPDLSATDEGMVESYFLPAAVQEA